MISIVRIRSTRTTQWKILMNRNRKHGNMPRISRTSSWHIIRASVPVSRPQKKATRWKIQIECYFGYCTALWLSKRTRVLAEAQLRKKVIPLHICLCVIINLLNVFFDLLSILRLLFLRVWVCVFVRFIDERPDKVLSILYAW